ncbi:CIC11C00000002781 [Sungouiella intermedia]|uniref:CIC11C00000002781 n=1 Tax=Sungouiella intermedia TaxID=45354 RepID=A0A1L0BRV9_9ASCO|nr:CIC11C00000002781 [[Candida] intermedia]
MFSSPDNLENSRASRIAWLLEELNVDYEIKAYPRTKEYLAPKELLDVFPTGMSPVLTIIKEGSEPLTIGESGHIVNYLIEYYDKNGKFTPKTHNDKELVDFYLHFSEGSIQPHLVSILVGNIAGQKVPWPFRFVTNQVFSKMNSTFYAKRLFTNFRYLDDQLAKKGGGYFVGDHLTGADFMLDFPINGGLFLDRADLVGQGKDMKKEFPNLYKWSQMIKKEPLRIKADEEAKAKL